MRDRVLDALANEGVLLEPKAADLVLSRSDPLEFVRAALAAMPVQPLVLTVEDLLPQHLIEALNRDLAKNGLAVSREVADFLIDLPCPFCYLAAALNERERRGLPLPSTITAKDLLVSTVRRWWER